MTYAIPDNRELVGSKHVDSLVFMILAAVRGEGPVIHFVKRDVLEDAFPAFCGAEPSPTARGTVRWKRVMKAGGRVCQTCQAAACASPTRISWMP